MINNPDISPEDLATRIKGLIDGPSHYAVYRVLIDKADANGHAWVSVNELSEMAFTSRSTTKRSIKHLVEAGLIVELPHAPTEKKTYQVYGAGQ